MNTEKPADPYVDTSGDLTLGHGIHVWTDEAGVTHGVARLGAVTITFHDPAQVRELIAYLAGVAGEMDAEIARQREPEPACVRCRSSAGLLVPLKTEPGWVCENSGACGRRHAATAAKAAAR